MLQCAGVSCLGHAHPKRGPVTQSFCRASCDMEAAIFLLLPLCLWLMQPLIGAQLSW